MSNMRFNHRNKRSGSAIRYAILGLILVIVLGMAIYEFAFSRPKYVGMTDFLAADAWNLTDEQIVEKVGIRPSEKLFKDGDYKLHTFKITRGLPVLSYNVYVWYQRSDGKYLLKSYKVDGEPSEDEIVPKFRPTIDHENAPIMAPMGGGGARTPDSSDGQSNPPINIDDDEDDDEGEGTNSESDKKSDEGAEDEDES
ncbi:MAG TPA: hypothetical protein PKD64_06015 [Pirellulaceae bacterium]|nr:hypothetical protein [Pirellulaceae bacterium]HMO91735.1 hypothetical protein [Pirellulaceae bacterium]HMP69802.1 hypothetical protein [Pirellulaceae bacterium]